MKRMLIGSTLFIVIVSSIIYIKLSFFPEPVELDVFKNIEIVYNGFDGDGYAEVSANEIKYNGNNQKIIDFIDNISYTISPNEKLKNYDEIIVKVNADKAVLKEANIQLRAYSRRYQVRGLPKTEQKGNVAFPENNNPPKEIETNASTEIPSEWNLSEEEKKAYLAYLKQIEENGNGEISSSGAEFEWQIGTGSLTKENAEFFSVDYMDNAALTYQIANNYGIETCQKYRIIPILEEEKTIGYSCIFQE